MGRKKGDDNLTAFAGESVIVFVLEDTCYSDIHTKPHVKVLCELGAVSLDTIRYNFSLASQQMHRRIYQYTFVAMHGSYRVQTPLQTGELGLRNLSYCNIL